MRRVLLTTIITLLVSLQFTGAEAAFDNLTPLEYQDRFELVSRDHQQALIQFTTPDIQWIPDEEWGEYPFLEGAGEEGVEGGPRLPVYQRFIAVPAGMDAVLENVSIEWEHAGQHQIAYDKGPNYEYKGLNPEVYASVSERAQETVTLQATGRWRDIRFAPLVVRPMRYNEATGEVEIAKDIDVTISYVPADDDGYDPPGVSEAFYPLYTTYILGAEDELDEVQLTRGSYLIITHESWVDELEALIEWRTQCGYNVIVATTEETGNETEEIHEFLDEIYEETYPPIEYVNLVGDVDDVASIETFYIPSGFHDPLVASDHFYTYDEAGGDELPNVFPRYFIGRMSADVASEVRTMVNKTIQYEKTPQTGDLDRFEKATMICTRYVASSTYQTKEWVRHKLEQHGFAEVDTFYQWQFAGPPDPNLIANSIDDGVSWVNYRGFGSHIGWEGPYFRVNNVAGLNNLNEAPIVTSMVCGGGAFDEANNDPCFGEKWIRHGTANSVKGAVVFISPTELDTHTKWNNCVDGGWYRAMFDFEMRSMGQLITAARMELVNAYPASWNANGQNTNSVWFYFHVYTILGDPAVKARTEIPSELTVTHPEDIEENASVFPVSVLDDADMPVADARVVITNNDLDIIASALTNDAGQVNLILNGAVEGDEITLTITRPDVIPYQTELNGTDTQGFSLESVDFSEDEDFENNNGDNMPNPGELVIPGATFTWEGDEAINDVTFTVSLPDGGGIVEVESQTFEAVEPNQTVTLDLLRLGLNASLQNEEPVELLFTIEADEFSQIHAYVLDGVQAPLLTISSYEFSASWEPGDTADLIFHLSNDHQDLATGELSATLASESDYVDIMDAEGGWDNIEP
ncbi:hypothetical protein K8I28_04940, partial [bacterium]|nr:hypothetical protein [bacterium]